MKKLILGMSLVLSSVVSAASLEFKGLDCSDAFGTLEKPSVIQIRLEEPASAINNSGLERELDSNVSIFYPNDGKPSITIDLGKVKLRQETKAFGYQLSLSGKFLNSDFNSFINVTPQITRKLFGNKLVGFSGEAEVNAIYLGQDLMIYKADVKCTIVE